MGSIQEWYELFGTNPGSNTRRNNGCTTTYLLSHKLSKWGEQDMQDTAEEAKTNTSLTFFYGPPHMDVPVFAGMQEFIYDDFVQTRDEVWETCRGRWKMRDGWGEGQGKLYCPCDLMMMMLIHNITDRLQFIYFHKNEYRLWLNVRYMKWCKLYVDKFSV